MAKIDKEVQKFIHKYSLNQQERWKAVVPDGHGGQIRKQGFINKSDAVEFAVLKYIDVLKFHKGLSLVISNILFRDYSEQWLEMKRRSEIGPAAAMRYEQEIRKRINPFFGFLKLANIEKYHLRSFIAELYVQEAGSSVIQYCVTLFKSIIRQAEIDDLIPPKGITLMQTPKHKKKSAVFWDQKEVQYFLNATSSHKLNDLWKFVLFSGLRAGEVAGLKWDAVRFDWKFGSYEGALEIKRAYNQKTRKMQETTKNNESRIVPIFPETKEILERLHTCRTGDFVFGGNQPLESSHFNRQLQTALRSLKECRLPTITFHGLRHSFCSFLDSTGMSRRVVSEIMGHRDLNTTNLYSHVNNRMLGDEVRRWIQSQSQQKANKLEVVNYQ